MGDEGSGLTDQVRTRRNSSGTGAGEDEFPKSDTYGDMEV